MLELPSAPGDLATASWFRGSREDTGCREEEPWAPSLQFKAMCLPGCKGVWWAERGWETELDRWHLGGPAMACHVHCSWFLHTESFLSAAHPLPLPPHPAASLQVHLTHPRVDHPVSTHSLSEE